MTDSSFVKHSGATTRENTEYRNFYFRQFWRSCWDGLSAKLDPFTRRAMNEPVNGLAERRDLCGSVVWLRTHQPYIAQFTCSKVFTNMVQRRVVYMRIYARSNLR